MHAAAFVLDGDRHVGETPDDPRVRHRVRRGRHRAKRPSASQRQLAQTLDRFDRVQLEDVLRACADAPTLRSRERKRVANDADRLRKYLARFGLEWSALKERLREAGNRD
jgi:sigma54-dependent transcription regulator